MWVRGKGRGAGGAQAARRSPRRGRHPASILPRGGECGAWAERGLRTVGARSDLCVQFAPAPGAGVYYDVGETFVGVNKLAVLNELGVNFTTMASLLFGNPRITFFPGEATKGTAVPMDDVYDFMTPSAKAFTPAQLLELGAYGNDKNLPAGFDPADLYMANRLANNNAMDALIAAPAKARNLNSYQLTIQACPCPRAPCWLPFPLPATQPGPHPCPTPSHSPTRTAAGRTRLCKTCWTPASSRTPSFSPTSRTLCPRGTRARASLTSSLPSCPRARPRLTPQGRAPSTSPPSTASSASSRTSRRGRNGWTGGERGAGGVGGLVGRPRSRAGSAGKAREGWEARSGASSPNPPPPTTRLPSDCVRLQPPHRPGPHHPARQAVVRAVRRGGCRR